MLVLVIVLVSTIIADVRLQGHIVLFYLPYSLERFRKGLRAVLIINL